MTVVGDLLYSKSVNVMERLARHIRRKEVRTHIEAYLAGLLGNVERRNGWQLSRATGLQNPYALQHILGRAVWDAEAVRDELRSFVRDALVPPRFNLRFGQIGFTKSGSLSAGVSRQYNHITSRFENCQVGMFLGCVTERYCVLIDRSLYLPRCWTRDVERRRRAKIPEHVRYSTKAELVNRMLRAVFDAGFAPAWTVSQLAQDSDTHTRSILESHQCAYVLATEPLPKESVCEFVTDGQLPNWRTIHGLRLEKFEWAIVRPAKAIDTEFRVILRQRRVDEPNVVADYAVYAPEPRRIEDIVGAIADRQQIVNCVTSARADVGLDQYEVRSWNAWYRHVTLVMWAYSLLIHRMQKDLEF